MSPALDSLMVLTRSCAPISAASLAGCLDIGIMLALGSERTPAVAGASDPARPSPPPHRTLAFVVDTFAPAFLVDAEVCPEGPALKARDVYLQSLPPVERARLLDQANQFELDERWQASLLGPGGTNICSQPDRFDRPTLRTVQSKRGPGLDLDGDDKAKSCARQEFVSPAGEQDIDNQAYRALGCKLESPCESIQAQGVLGS